MRGFASSDQGCTRGYARDVVYYSTDPSPLILAGTIQVRICLRSMLRLPAALHRSSSPYDGFLIDTLRPCNHRASAFPLRGCRLRQFSYTTGGSLSRFNRRRICTLDRQFIKLLLYLTELCETYQDVLPPVAPIPFEDQNTTRLIPFALRRLIRRSFGQCARAHHPRNWQPPLAARPRTTLPAP